MNSKTRQYLFGIIFLAVGVYQLVINDLLEFGLYGMAGAAFIVNAITMEPRFSSQKKPLVIISWILIAGTGILFLYLLQFKYL
jgi:hypothetical protein